MTHILASIADGSLLIDAADDLDRIGALLDGAGRAAFTAAAVVACAERLGSRVLTFAPGGYAPLATDVTLVSGRAAAPVH
jgi:hypothetical protein